MPLYEYQCGSCGKSSEALQKVNEAPLIICPHCGKDQLKRQMSAPRFQLKGTGWYETDFKTSKKPPEADATPAADTKTESNKPSENPSAPTAKPDKEQTS